MSIPIIPSEEVVSISKWIPITKAYRYELKPTKNQEVKTSLRKEPRINERSKK